MKTKYGDIPNEMIVNYKQRLIDKVFKILPMKEEGWDTWNLYIETLLYEFIGNQKLIKSLNNDPIFLSVISILNSLIDEEHLPTVKRKVFSCIDLIEKLWVDCL